MVSRSKRISVLVVIVGLMAFGCAKRPALTQVSAPSPAGTAVAAAPPPAPPAPAPAPAAPPPTPPPAAVAPATPPPAPAEPAPTPVTPPVAVAPAPTPPAPAAAPRPERRDFAEEGALRDVHFDFDKSNIRPDAAKTLDANASWMKSNPNHLILIEGHCDERGTNEYNLALGERRARSAMNYLVGQGVEAARITILSYGEERPQCTPKTEACWAQNRRAHFLVKAQ
jgi:peptidoglycan-associated lipoprotein